MTSSLDFLKGARCGREGCRRPAVWYPALELRAEPTPPHALGPMTRVLFNIYVCDQCYFVSEAEDFLAGEDWPAIAAEFALGCGGRSPRRELTTVAFVSIESGGKPKRGPTMGRA